MFRDTFVRYILAYLASGRALLLGLTASVVPDHESSPRLSRSMRDRLCTLAVPVNAEFENQQIRRGDGKIRCICSALQSITRFS